MVRHIEMGNCFSENSSHDGIPESVPSIVQIEPYNSQKTVLSIHLDLFHLSFMLDYFNPGSIVDNVIERAHGQIDNTDYGTFGDEDGNPL